MAWRFKTSKFKNTVPSMPKKGDTIYDLPVSGVTTTNNSITANAALYAFHIDGEGGKLGLLPTSTRGRKPKHELSVICAHSDNIQDLTFLPFTDNLLATCAKDDPLKLWSVDPNGNEVLNEPIACIANNDYYLESLAAHPNASNLLAAGHSSGMFIVDTERASIAIELSMDDCERLHSLSWNGNGQTLAASQKNGSVTIFDPRAQATPIQRADGHSGMSREGRVLWLGNEGKLLSSGFTKTKNREILLYDERNWKTPFVTQQHEPSTGILVPLYDPDTKLIFLAGKGSNKMMIYELTERDPYLAEVAVHNAPEQTIGCCLLPKSSVDVMKGEVGVFVQMTKTSIVPVSCTVIRTSYRDFIPDLFPSTVCNISGTTCVQWLQGCNSLPPKYSLDPAKTHLIDVEPAVDAPLQIIQKPAPEALKPNNKEPPKSMNIGATNGISKPTLTSVREKRHDSDTENTSPPPPAEITGKRAVLDSPFLKDEPIVNAAIIRERPPTSPKPLVSMDLPAPEVKLRAKPVGDQPDKRRTTWIGIRQSKFKYVKVNSGTDMSKVMFTNVRSTKTNMPNESDSVCVSEKWIAIPLGAGAVGTVAILDLSKPTKIPDGVIPGLENRANVNDLVWCPFDSDEIACGCDNGAVNIWRVTGALTAHSDPAITFYASNDRVNIVRYHPTAKDLLAVVSGTNITMWDIVDSGSGPKLTLNPHCEPVISLSWSPFGKQLVTVCKDKNLYVYEPHTSTAPIQSTCVMDRVRSARAFFACRDQMLCVIHFTSAMSRMLSLYELPSLNKVHSYVIGDSTPALLVPHYDFDTNIVILTAKGDRTVHMFEIVAENPWLLPLQTFSEDPVHQGICMHMKNVCDVKKVEVTRGWRITDKTVQRLTFTVPRRDSHLFSPDMFPTALAKWISVTTAKEWLQGNGVNIMPHFICLKPEDMESSGGSPPSARPLSSVPTPAPRAQVPLPPSVPPPMEDNEKITKLVGSLMEAADTIDVAAKSMQQDLMEGVDPKEWEED